MAVSIESHVEVRIQHIREMRRIAQEQQFQDENNFQDCRGRLKLLSAGKTGSPVRQCHFVAAQLYPTCTGGMLVFWPDKLYAQPIGSFQLRDFIVSESTEQKLAFTLRPRDSCDDDQPLTLICLNLNDHQQWKAAFNICYNSTARKRLNSINRLPCLAEE